MLPIRQEVRFASFPFRDGLYCRETIACPITQKSPAHIAGPFKDSMKEALMLQSSQWTPTSHPLQGQEQPEQQTD